MNSTSLAEALRPCLGKPAHFGPLWQRVEILFDQQIKAWDGNPNGWLIIPVQRMPRGFYLLSGSREGQRRGQEVLAAFVGPAMATTEPETLVPQADSVDRILEHAGLYHLLLMRRNTRSGMDEFLARIEDAVSTVLSNDATPRRVQSSHVELLRDFRLALLARDGRLARARLDDIQLTGRLSAENIRFLTVEMFGGLRRWAELRDLPFVTELLRARRPRAVNEILLEMVWHTELAGLVSAGKSAAEVFAETDLGARYGALTGSIDVPSSAAGRAVVAIVARALGDYARASRVVDAADDATEADLLDRLTAVGGTAPTIVTGGVRGLFDQGQFTAAIEAFLAAPTPETAELAIQSVLDSEERGYAAPVLRLVNEFIAEGALGVDRRLRRDLGDLTDLVDQSCSGWPQWCARISRPERWPNAERVLRDHSPKWMDLTQLSAEELTAAADGLLAAWGGANQDQIVATLDILCRAVAESGTSGRTTEFRTAVLLVLAEQQNLSEPVRNAYLLLLERILDAGQSADSYRDIVLGAEKLWQLIAAPVAVDWGLTLVDLLLEAPCPEPGVRSSLASGVVNWCWAHRQRLNLRQVCELAEIARECGLGLTIDLPEPTEKDSIWRALDGKMIAVYSLLDGAADALERRLSSLCAPSSVEGNADKVGTTALRTLASRADYLIVDTRHAAHAATKAIDEVRPREKQTFPAGRGISAFLRALEGAIS